MLEAHEGAVGRPKDVWTREAIEPAAGAADHGADAERLDLVRKVVMRADVPARVLQLVRVALVGEARDIVLHPRHFYVPRGVSLVAELINIIATSQVGSRRLVIVEANA